MSNSDPENITGDKIPENEVKDDIASDELVLEVAHQIDEVRALHVANVLRHRRAGDPEADRQVR